MLTNSSSPQSKKDKLLDTLALISLKHAKEDTSERSVIAESGRIERAIEYFYKKDPAKSKKLSLDYNEFVIDFIMKNYKEFVFGHGFVEFSDQIEKELRDSKKI